jgi:hypothetical protein
MDKFPEAFRRFEETVDVDRIESFNELRAEFAMWAGRNWKNTASQNKALATEALRRGIPIAEGVKRHIPAKEGFTRWLRRAEQAQREWAKQKFSVKYVTYHSWREQKARTTAYVRRIENYILNHPHATLAEARGHGRRRR